MPRRKRKTRAIKPTIDERLERVEAVRELLLRGHRTSYIKTYIRSKFDSDLDARTIQDYISDAQKMNADDWSMRNQDNANALVMTITSEMLKLLTESDKWPAKVKASSELRHLHGLSAPRKVALTTPDGREPYKLALADLSDAQVSALAEIAKQFVGRS
jgi:hypothetical protein